MSTRTDKPARKVLAKGVKNSLPGSKVIRLSGGASTTCP
jgi:hypothetical protein